MSRGLRLFRIIGITISVDFTWFVVFFLFSWSLAYGYYPSRITGLTLAQYMAMGTASALMLFVCVLLHELSHSYTSNRLGIAVKEITLFIFGGVAHISEEPDTPQKELKIALAGPLASGALAVFFIALSRIAVALSSDAAPTPVIEVADFLATINVVLMVFNLVPGLPLDGGRVLRALWWIKTGDKAQGTRVAGHVGHAFAVFLIVMGFLQSISGNFSGGLWSVLIGVFLMQAAKGTIRQVEVQEGIEGLLVREIMTAGVVTVGLTDTLEDIVRERFLHHHLVSFPVMNAGRVAGLITLAGVRGIRREEWPTTTAGEVMEPVTAQNSVSPDDTVMRALTLMAETGSGRFMVMAGTELVGMISRRDIMKTVEFKSLLGGHG